MPETTTELATIDPKVSQELKVVTEAISVSLAVREITVDFAKRRDEAIYNASEFLSPPTTDDEQSDILTAQRALQGLRKEVEKQAAALKAPLNAARKNIIDIEDRASESISKEEKRLQGLVNNYQNKLADARRADENRLEAERKRIADLAAQAERERQEAERKRQAAETATPAAAAVMLKEAAELDADSFGKLLEAESAPIPPAVPSAPAPQARTIRTFSLAGRNDYEKGESLEKFHRAHPELFAKRVVEEGEGTREYVIRLKIKDLTDAINGVAPFAKIESAPGLVIHERLSTLR